MTDQSRVSFDEYIEQIKLYDSTHPDATLEDYGKHLDQHKGHPLETCVSARIAALRTDEVKA